MSTDLVLRPRAAHMPSYHPLELPDVAQQEEIRDEKVGREWNIMERDQHGGELEQDDPLHRLTLKSKTMDPASSFHFPHTEVRKGSKWIFTFYSILLSRMISPCRENISIFKKQIPVQGTFSVFLI